MERGEIRPILLSLPDRSAGGELPPGIEQKEKYVILLQSRPHVDEVAVVVCSSLRSPRPKRPYEVFLGKNHGFDHDTVVDCRWVFTVQKRHLRRAVHPKLPASVMQEISIALVDGLEL